MRTSSPPSALPPSRRRLEPALVLLLTIACLPALAALLTPPAQAADWPEFNGDGRHLGNNQQETTINSGNVSTLHVLPGFPVTLPSVADGPPVFLSGVQTASGIKDLLFLTTKDGHILALNAATGANVWSHQPATGPNYTTSSPAIDPNRLYVYSYGLEGKVHKYQVGDGTEITTGGWPELATLKPSVEKCSPPLSVVVTNSGAEYLYVANGGYPGDAGDYQGHITAINLATGTQNVFNAMCSDQAVHFVMSPGTPDCSGGVQSAVWGRPSVVYSSELDRIFFTSSNGTYDASTGGRNWGDSVLAAHPDGTGANGQPLDSYTPTEFQTLQNEDLDLGSTSPALLPPVPGSNVAPLAVQGGKDSQLRLLKLADLSRAGGPAHVGGELQVLGLPQGGEILTQPAVWVSPVDGTVWVFVANGGGITGLKMVVDGMGNPSMSAMWTNGSGGTSVVVANGLVFYVSGGVKALDPTTGNQLFGDTSPGGIHWESLIVIDGRLYVADESAHLWAYAPAAAPLGFFTVAPCRVVDTRGPTGPYGGPALAGFGSRRAFQLAGQCGIPADAKAVAANVTVVNPSAAGDLRIGPSGVANVTSSLNFSAGRLLASNTVIGLTGDPLGTAWVQSDGAGSANLLIDVSGYYK
ncbi:MAG TPA: PQQ-binding-like beta-propeller repeat protein [Thermoanaerobaculia bacterium]|nr:PQQ-binding-like beta-propeller repeat protein [Thermoanaerobaculia bacterium]